MSTRLPSAGGETEELDAPPCLDSDVMAPDLAPATMQRLATIRLLFSRAEEDSRQSAPYSWNSINALHDVVEMFLVLATQELHVPVNHKKQEFLGYWDEISKKLDSPLGYKRQMMSVNNARVAFKHHGNEPTQRTIESAREAVRGLLYDETPRLFGVELDQVSMAQFVTYSPARDFLSQAEQHWPDQPGHAFADLATAFDELLSDYVDGKHGFLAEPGWLEAPDLRTATTYLQTHGSRRSDSSMLAISALREYDRRLGESLRSLRTGLRVVGLGIDLKRHARFKALTPEVSGRAAGGRSWQEPVGMIRTQEEFDFCVEFVVSTALRLAEFDYEPPRREENAGRGVIVRRD